MVKQTLVLVLGMWLLGTTAAWADDLVVVVNENAPVQNLTAEEIKNIYLGEKGFWGNTKISPVGYQDGAALQASFLDRVLSVSENVYKTYWIKRIFREGGMPPDKAGSVDDALRMVTQHSGGITFVPASKVAGASGIREVYRMPN